MLVELSPPLTAALFAVMVVALVAGVVRGNRRPRAPLVERLAPAVFAEDVAACALREPTEVQIGWWQGVMVAVLPTSDVEGDGYGLWHVRIGAAEPRLALCREDIRRLVADGLATIEAARAQGAW